MNRGRNRSAGLAVLISFLWSVGAVSAGQCCPGDAAEAGGLAGLTADAHAAHGAGQPSTDGEPTPPPCHCLVGSCVATAPALPAGAPILQVASVTVTARPDAVVRIPDTASKHLIPWSLPPPAAVV